MFYVFEKPQSTGNLYEDPNRNEIKSKINSIFILDGNMYHVYIPSLCWKVGCISLMKCLRMQPNHKTILS